MYLLSIVVEFDAVGELEGEEERVAYFSPDVSCCEVVEESVEAGLDFDFLDLLLAGVALVQRGVEDFGGEEVFGRPQDFVLR